MSRFNMNVEQIIGIVKNLPDDQKRQVFRKLAKEMRQKRQELMLAPGLAALWVGLVTPIPNRLAVPLVEGIVHSLVADTTRARAIFPTIQPMSYREAVRLALLRIKENQVETHWSGAQNDLSTYHLTDREGLIREEQSVWVRATPEAVFAVFSSLGGERGWLVWNWAWRIRGIIDKVVEMRLPGKAWLEFEAIPELGGTRLIQRALFEPRGLAGTLYWYALCPAHRVIFRQMVQKIAQLAETVPQEVSR